MQDTYVEECPVCGDPLPTGDLLLDHGHVDVVVRDGWRGQYLAPTAVLDVEGLIPGTFDAECLAAANAWLSQMGGHAINDVTEHQYEIVMDDSTYLLEEALSSNGYAIVWDDGYIIYRIEGGGDA